MRSLIRAVTIVWIIFFGLSVPLRAHDPFDGATRMFVHDSTIEVEVTMGSDAAREFLRGAGLPPREVARMTRPNEGTEPIELPFTLASHLYEVRTGSDLVEAKSCVGRPTEGETIFIASYPRPKTNTLLVRAVYFSGIPFMHTGPFTAGDDKGNPLAYALLTAQSPPLTVPLVAAINSPLATTLTTPRPSFVEYIKLGIVHILTGFDHLLFLCALLVGVRKMRPMLAIITCFTIGHSITLALAALNLVMISSRVVEPLIAASIIVVGLENFIRPNVTVDRYWMAGVFGLIHGFGFASALRETGLGSSGGSIVVPLFSFNLGVEVGQLLVAAVVLPILLLSRRKPLIADYSIPIVSAVVILISGYWLLERTIFVH